MRSTLGGATLLLTLALALAGSSHADDEPVFGESDHCVAYRAIKDMLFASDVVIVGRSCEVTAKLEAGDAGSHQIRLEVPIDSLRSGNVMRNYAVSDILGAKEQPNLQFVTDPLDVAVLRRNLSGTAFNVSGKLRIAGVEHPLSFPVAIVRADGKRYASGTLSTRFADFDLEPPVAGGGLIARVHENLDLLIHLDLEQIDGLEQALQ